MKIAGPALILLIILSVCLKISYSQNKVDIGIFESDIPDTLVVKAKPNYSLTPPFYITNIVFTLRWPDTSNVTELITIASTVNSFFGLQVQTAASNGGYNYRVYAVVGSKYVTWTAGEEYPILEILVNEPGGDCADFEISDDEYTRNTLNGGYWFEVVGANRTGIRYEPVVSLGTTGGSVTGDEEICLGSSTSVMTLSGSAGLVLTWQKKHDAFTWMDINGTVGLTEYSAIPDSSGTYLYRAKVQRGSCTIEYSTAVTITVKDYSQWTGETDTDWANTINWNICGVPDLNREVIIPQVPSNLYPVIQVSAACKSIDIKNGAMVTVTATGSLNIQSTGP